MSDLRCAFDGHAHRADICEGGAVSFLRTPGGVIWPFCGPCGERQKVLVMEMVGTKAIDHQHVVDTTFDIPINNEATLAEFQAQDPEKIRVVLARADAMHAELVGDDDDLAV